MPLFTNEDIVSGPLTDTELRASAVPVTIPTPVPVTDNSGSLTVDGTVTANAGTGNFTVTQATGTNLHVVVDNTVATSGGSTGTATVTSVSVSTTVATLSASNAAKTGVIIFNETGTLFVKLGSGATSSSYTYRLTSNTELEINGYYGIVTAIKASGTSNALVTELGI